MTKVLRVSFFAFGLALLGTSPALAQFAPYFGKNKVRYDTFAWRIYKSPHFEIYYYPELEPHLARVASYAESAYQKVSSELKHSIEFAIPLVLYKTHSEFEQTHLFPDFVPEGVAAFADSVRNRMVLPIDEPSDKLQGLITHELTHIFEYDLIPRNLIQREVPLWVDEGLADYMRGTWESLDLMMVRDAAISDQVPRISRVNDYGPFGSPRVIYNLGHAAFEFIEARWGKEGIRQFLYMFRKTITSGGTEEIYQQAFRIKPDEFDKAFDRWLKERFKPYRDKQRPEDYGQDLSPSEELTSFSQVYAFSPGPSGDVIAALTGNRSDQEVDAVILSAKDGTVIKNLTKGFTGRYEDIAFNTDFVSGRAISFDPRGDFVAFFARSGKRRNLFLVSVLTGKLVRRIPLKVDQAQAPCLLPDGRRLLFAALKDGVSDLFLLDLDNGKLQNLTNDPFADDNPQVSPDGSLVVYNRRMSGYDKVFMFPLGNPARKTQVSFGTFDDKAPAFSADGKRIFYSSTEDDDIYNVRSLDLATGVIRQYTDAVGGNMAPAVLPGKGPERVAFVAYFKGNYALHTLETQEAQKEVEQDVQATLDEELDFEPDVRHQVVTEQKRKKGPFEKLMFAGRPPLDVGITSGGDFFGGSQAAISDVLEDHRFLITAQSLREFRSYDFTYLNASRRLHWAVSLFDSTRFFYASPYDLQPGFSRQGAFATRRLLGGTFGAAYSFSKFRRLELGAGFYSQRERFENLQAQAAARARAEALGLPFVLNDGNIAPLSLRWVEETTRFREFGPLSGHTLLLGFEVAPAIGSLISRETMELDARGYVRILGDSVIAGRVRAFRSTGQNPAIFEFGGDMDLRGYPYLSFAGNEGFHVNLEFRAPLVHVMATPIGLLGPVRGTLFAGLGGARFQGTRFDLATREPGTSYVNDLLFGEPVSGLHLVDGRASYGVGLQFFFAGLPFHFDWSKLTDLKVSSPWRFDFWIGYDF